MFKYLIPFESWCRVKLPSSHQFQFCIYLETVLLSIFFQYLMLCCVFFCYENFIDEICRYIYGKWDTLRGMHMCDWHDPSVAGIIIGKGIHSGMNFSWKFNETCINSEKHAKGWKWRVGVLCSFPLIMRFFRWCGVKGVE